LLKEKGKQQQHNFLSSFLFNLFVNLMVIYLSNPLSFSPFWLLLFSFHNFRSQKGLEKDWIRN